MKTMESQVLKNDERITKLLLIAFVLVIVSSVLVSLT